MREIIKESAPEAQERICMKMPTYDQKRKWMVHFAAYDQYWIISQPEGDTPFENEPKDYKMSKGSIHFPHSQGLPLKSH